MNYKFHTELKKSHFIFMEVILIRPGNLVGICALAKTFDPTLERYPG